MLLLWDLFEDAIREQLGLSHSSVWGTSSQLHVLIKMILFFYVEMFHTPSEVVVVHFLVYVRVCDYVDACSHMCACAWRRDIKVRCLPPSLGRLSPRQSLSIEFRIDRRG